MRLWALALLMAILAVCALTAFGFIERNMPTEQNDHLLDGVKGLGGPKSAPKL